MELSVQTKLYLQVRPDQWLLRAVKSSLNQIYISTSPPLHLSTSPPPAPGT